MQFKIALRNVFRNRRRTLFSLAVIVVGTSVFLFLLGFIGEALNSTKRSLACETGAVQVADERLFENTADAYEVLIPPQLRERTLDLIAARPGVTGASWQLSFAGLIGDERGSTLVIGRGVVPCRCVEDYECIIVSGDPLPEDASRQTILGASLAAKLDVEPGDRINVATGTVSGNFNAATVDVIGTLRYSLEGLEAQLGLFPIGFVQRLLKTDGVERILIGLEDLDDAEAFAASLQAELDAAGIPLATRTWEELNPSYESLSSFYTAFSGLAGIAVFALVFFSVVEVLTLSFLERTREIGTLRAFGTSRGRIFRTFLLEGILLGLIGAILGVLVGSVLAAVFNAVGVEWTPPGAPIPQALRLALSPSVAVVPFATAILATLTSALIPAWKSSRQRIVEALKTA
jgi:putative ABC transport system permease protein